MFLFIKKPDLAYIQSLKDITSLLEILKSKSEEATIWFETDPIFANTDKFQVIVVHHNKNTNENYSLKVNNIEIESKKEASQLQAICRLQNQMGKKEKKYLQIVLFTQTLIIVHLTGNFDLKTQCEKLKDSGKMSPIILYDYGSNYDALLNKSGNSIMEVKRLRTTEILKTLKNQNPSSMR